MAVVFTKPWDCTDLSPALLSVAMAKMETPVCADVRRHGMEERALRKDWADLFLSLPESPPDVATLATTEPTLS
jgi:hypothetical protein